MLEPSLMSDAMDVIHTREIFYDMRHKLIWMSILGMSIMGDAVDIITIHNKLRSSGKLEQVGGLEYLTGLPDKTPSSSSWEDYAQILIEKWMRRKSISACTEAVAHLYDESTDRVEVLNIVEAKLLDVSTGESKSHIKSVGSCVPGVMEELDRVCSSGNNMVGIPTGFVGINDVLLGLQGSHVTVIAARPSIGKTALCLNILTNIAKTGVPVGIFSLEMDAGMLVRRIIGSESEVNLKRINASKTDELNRVSEAAVMVKKLPIYIEDGMGMTESHIRLKARRMVKGHGIKALAVDYLQLIEPSERRSKRSESVAAMSRAMKLMSRELDIPVLLISQLNRGLDKDGARRPVLADLVESGAIEQDADEVGLMWRPKTVNDRKITITWAKNRHGETTEFELDFVPEWTRFYDSQPEEEGDPTQREGYLIAP